MIQELTLDESVDAVSELRRRFDPRGYRLDLRQAPLMRMIVAPDVASGRWLLMQLKHHIISDQYRPQDDPSAGSACVHLTGEQDRLPSPVPFRNFVAQARLGGMSAAEHEAFFTRMLSEVEEPVAPFGLLDVQGDGSGITEARIMLEADLARRMRECARAANVSVASLCHLAYARMLGCLSAQHKVVFGTVLFGRMQGREGIERALGVFINTLPICIEITEQGVAESLRQTHALLAELLMHEHASLAVAQRCSAVPPPTPLFSALFNYRHHGPRVPDEQALQGVEVLYGQERTNYPFSGAPWNELRREIHTRGAGECRDRSATGVRLPAHGVGSPGGGAGAGTAHATEPDRGAAFESERHQLLEQWNDTEVEYPAGPMHSRAVRGAGGAHAAGGGGDL